MCAVPIKEKKQLFIQFCFLNFVLNKQMNQCIYIRKRKIYKEIDFFIHHLRYINCQPSLNDSRLLS